MKLYQVVYRKRSHSDSTETVLIVANTLHQVNEDFKKFAKKNWAEENGIRNVSILYDNVRVAK